MRAYILAAGSGTRLGKYTENLPKGMLNFLGKSLLQRQVETLKNCGITDITIIKGYNSEKITIKEVKYLENKEYATTNMVATLMVAHDEIKDTEEEIIICYSDIIYEPRLIKKIIGSEADVNILVDDDWQEYWKARLDDWKQDVESLQYDVDNNITEIGTPRCPLHQAMSRYIGIIKFSPIGAKELVKAYDENKKKYWDKDIPWKKSKSFKKAYMTCMIQELIDRKVDVKVVHVNHGWMEFDTVEDYEKAIEWSKSRKLKEFINVN